MKGEPVVRVVDVYKSFLRQKVLEGVSFDVYPGETFTIMGGSGQGKSVLLKLLLGLIKPEKGHIFLWDKDIVQLDEDEILPMRKRIGMVFQASALFDSLTVYENIAFPLREHSNMSDEEIEKKVKEALELVNLRGVLQKLPSELSGGMKKRVALARAIILEPEIILYDEPTSGLDPLTARRIGELIKRISERTSCTTSIIVTHDIELAFHVSDRIGMLHNKRIIFIGKPEEFRSHESDVIREFISGEWH